MEIKTVAVLGAGAGCYQDSIHMKKINNKLLQDLDAGRHTEIDMFSGALVHMGRELGIPTPYNEYTYHIIKAIEEKNDGKFDYSKETGKVTCSR